ncbi:MAG TPA: cobyric acid synthase [Methylomirabilota bacterium]|jgi:adenosylcobyric acid synthase|nr:cobyric acid synthase [Methylomirabilota bacterium]
MNARSLMIMGTASDVGKSVMATALCRIFARAGIRVAPFKSQNMSNNAAVCPGGGEIGRAQAVQAEACGLEPTVDMNPVLLKPESEVGCQVVIRGQARFHMRAHEHQRYRAEAWPEIVASYRALAARFELVVIEGAGSAAEINLRARDIVNWTIAELADAPVLLVADIDKGGVFASLVGTIELLSPAERQRVKGFLINKFRGDIRLLESGLRLLEERTGIPVFGVVPYLRELRIPQEDAAILDATTARPGEKPLAFGVVRLPRISNYTDFAPLELEPDVAVHYVSDPESVPRLDVVCLPGSKSTVADLQWLRRARWETYLTRHVRDGGWLVGICGGYQMLGQDILDPHHVESAAAETVGLGFLDVVTTFAREKITAQVEGAGLGSGPPVSGYEIHAGRVTRQGAALPLLRLTMRNGQPINELEGAHSLEGRVWGTAIHGLFDNALWRRQFLDRVRVGKGLTPLVATATPDALTYRLRGYDRFADLVTAHVDLARIFALVTGRKGG